VRPDGAGQFCGKVVDVQDEDDDDDVDGGGGGNCWFVRFSPLSREVGSRFGSSGLFCLASGSLGPPGSPGPCGGTWAAAIFLEALWASGACGSCAGVPRAATVFPQLTPAPEFADLGAVYGADAEESVHGSPSVRWVSGSDTHTSFFSLFGAFWASGARGSCDGVPRAAAVFPWSVPDPGIRLFR
jgi:hypothetical protein